MERRTPKSMLKSTVEINEIIRVYVGMQLKDIVFPEKNLFQPQKAAFNRIVTEIAEIIFENNSKTKKLLKTGSDWLMQKACWLVTTKMEVRVVINRGPQNVRFDARRILTSIAIIYRAVYLKM